MEHISLFSGIGGDTLAAEWAGFKTVLFVEIDKFCQKILKKHWPDVLIHGDIKDFDGTRYRDTITLISGGDPCQPQSIAGKRRGEADDRYLWPEMFRVISEVSPTWVVNENPTGRLTMDFYKVLSDLEGAGYETQAFVIPACAVNAPHKRDRLYIVAYYKARGIIRDKGTRRLGRLYQDAPDTNECLRQSSSTQSDKWPPQRCYKDATNPWSWELERAITTGAICRGGLSPQYYTVSGWNENWIEVAASLCGIFNGFSFELDETGGLDRYAYVSERINGQDLPCLWQGFQSQAFQWQIGGFNPIQQQDYLFTILWKLFSLSYRQDNLPFESKTVQEAYLRNMWHGDKPRYPPQGWRYQEQYSNEHSDTLSQLSYEIALATKELANGYTKDRVARLKALGNSQVPQQVYPIFKAIADIENGTDR